MKLIDETDTSARFTELAQRAVRLRPKLFALHGVDAVTERDILGWGMEFTDRKDTVLYLPTDSLTYYTESAERAALRYSTYGDIEITWLN